MKSAIPTRRSGEMGHTVSEDDEEAVADDVETLTDGDARLRDDILAVEPAWHSAQLLTETSCVKQRWLGKMGLQRG